MKKINLKKEQLSTVCNRWSLLLHAVACFLGYFVIEAISRHSVLETLTFLGERTLVYLYNVFLIFLTTLPVYLLRRRIFARIFVAVFWLFLGIVNGMLLANRVTPFTGPDLKLLKEGLGIFNKYLSPTLAIVVSAAVVGIIVLVILTGIKAPRYKGKMNYLLYLGGMAAAAGLLALITNVAIEARILSTYFGNIAVAYEDYGYPYCLCVTVFDTGVDKPNGYSEELLDSIETKSNQEATDKTKLPNIVAVQLESFFDPYMVRYLELSEDPIPYFRSLMENYSSGLYTVPSVGAGTANTEFETLTGMSMRYFGAGEYPYKGVVKSNPCESAASVLSDLGYGTYAIHNNEANFYSRRVVYSKMGFDVFTSAEYMDTQDDVNALGWMRDEHLTKYIEASLDHTEHQDFVFAVSVQGHGAYPSKPIDPDQTITVEGAPSEASDSMWEYYVNQIYEMDLFIKDLVEMLEERGEDTVLLLYGDHLPTMGLSETDMENFNLFTTQYVIWDNMGLEREEKDLAAYQVMAELFDKVDIHDGTIFRFHQNARELELYQTDLQTLQYDMLYGRKYVYGGEEPFEPTTIQLGVKVPVIERVESLGNDTYVIYGKNFTQSCKIKAAGKLIENVEYINPETIRVPSMKIHFGNKVCVAVQSNSSTARVLSSSEVVVYEISGVNTMMANAVTALDAVYPEESIKPFVPVSVRIQQEEAAEAMEDGAITEERTATEGTSGADNLGNTGETEDAAVSESGTTDSNTTE